MSSAHTAGLQLTCLVELRSPSPSVALSGGSCALILIFRQERWRSDIEEEEARGKDESNRVTEQEV
eukprot:752434-Hanusia_phi.AAC.2